MKLFSTSFFLLLFSFNLVSQDAYHTNLLSQLQNDYGLTGGTFLFGNNETTKLSSMYNYGLTASTTTVSGEDFTQSLILDAPAGYPFVYSCGAGIFNNISITAGDRMLLVVWIKGISDANGTNGVGKLIVERGSSPYEKSLDNVSFFNEEWTQYLLPFEALNSYSVGESQFAIQLGYREQEVQLGGLAIINYESAYTIEQLPMLE
jgi:hypothetical protein